MADNNNKRKPDERPKPAFTITNHDTKRENSANKRNSSKRSVTNRKKLSSLSKLVYRYSGIVLAVCATIYLTCSYFLIKLAKSLNPAEMGAIKFFVTLLLSGLAALFWKQNPLGPKESRLLLILRGLCGSIALILNYFSIQYINYSDSTILRNASPLLTGLFAAVFLKESLNISHLFSGMVTAIGLLFISRPSFIFGTLTVKSSNIDNNGQFYLGICLAILSTVFFGSAYIFIKKLTKTQLHFSIILFYLSAIGFLVSFLNAFTLYLTGNSYQDFQAEFIYIKRDAGLAILAGIINFFGHFCLTTALIKENSNTISMMRFLDIGIAFFLEYFITRVTPDLFSISGAAFITASLLILLVYKIIVKKANEIFEKEQKLRQKAIYRI